MLTAATIGEVVRELVPRAAFELRPDVADALRRAMGSERSERGRAVLAQLVDNAAIARRDAVPLCQDTGTVWVSVLLGRGETLSGDVQAAVDAAVAAAYREAGLRMSVVRDALFDRENTGDNTPAFVDIGWRDGTGATVTVMLKGGGSDNASRVVMLAPGDGLDGVERVVLETVREKATGACPPLIVGVGVGATFDRVGALAKKALLRPVGDGSPDVRIREFEERLLAAVNSTGIGPAGLGGDTTALAVKVQTAPCHIAALPVAVNMGCSAMRSATAEVSG